MKSNMEEADGRFVFHAVHAAHAAKNGVRKIVLSSPDLDVCSPAPPLASYTCR